jgi:hypothetical protein
MSRRDLGRDRSPCTRVCCRDEHQPKSFLVENCLHLRRALRAPLHSFSGSRSPSFASSMINFATTTASGSRRSGSSSLLSASSNAVVKPVTSSGANETSPWRRTRIGTSEPVSRAPTGQGQHTASAVARHYGISRRPLLPPAVCECCHGCLAQTQCSLWVKSRPHTVTARSASFLQVDMRELCSLGAADTVAVFEEEAQHLPRGVRPSRIGVGAGGTAAPLIADGLARGRSRSE